MNIGKYIFGFVFGLVLASFTMYVVLDTFVITRVYSIAVDNRSSVTQYSGGTADDSENVEEEQDGTDETGQGTQETGGSTSGRTKTSKKHSGSSNSTDSSQNTDNGQTTGSGQSTSEITDMSYQDENMSIVITEYYAYDTAIYVADIRVSSPEYLQTALAQNAYGKNVTETTSDMAESNNAILAINGDYYGTQEKGYVLRNGTLYRSTAARDQEDLVIYADGSFSIITETDVSAEQLLADGAVQILSFGPALVTDGSVSVTEDEEVGKAKANNPRTAIGIIDELHYVFVVSDGRTDESEGLSLFQLAEFMKTLGVDTAYNLDGGGSSTMYFNGNIINNPTSTGNSIKERSVSDIVYIGY